MTTPLIILMLLIIPALIGLIVERKRGRTGAGRAGAGLGLAIAFGFFASGHFIMTDEMVEMLPEWVPERRLLVIATGVLEIVIAMGLAWGRSRKLAGYVAALVLVLFFPANVYAAINGVGPGGHQWGPEYLWIRAPLQIFVLGWAYWFIIREWKKITL